MSFKTIVITFLILGTQATLCDVRCDRGLKLAGHQYDLNGLTGYDLRGCDAAVQQSTEAAEAVNLANKAIKIHSQAAALYKTTGKTAEIDLRNLPYDEKIREKSANLMNSTQASLTDARHFADIATESACKKSGFDGHNSKFRYALRLQDWNSSESITHLNTMEHCTKKLTSQEQEKIIAEVDKAFQAAADANKARNIVQDELTACLRSRTNYSPNPCSDSEYADKEKAYYASSNAAETAECKAEVAANGACRTFGHDGYSFVETVKIQRRDVFSPFNIDHCYTTPL
jgi:hypothetical protein